MTTTLARSTNAADHPAAARKLLSFCLGTEEFGLDILSVREIIGLIDITPMPRTPAHVKGVINLRGKIIPVIDLRTRFGRAWSRADVPAETSCFCVTARP